MSVLVAKGDIEIGAAIFLEKYVVGFVGVKLHFPFRGVLSK